MTVPAIDPPTPRSVEELLRLEHELDVANDTHPARPNTWCATEPAPPPAG